MGWIADRAVLLTLWINTAAALIGGFVALFQPKGRRSTLLMLSWLVLLCPVAAPLFLGCARLIVRLYRTQDLDLADVSFSKRREKILLAPDRQLEMNYAPLADAMAVADAGERRQLLIDVLKTSNQKVMTSVVRAIDHQDTEVSHYAAAAVLDALSDFRANLQNLLHELQIYPDIVSLNLHTLEYISQMLKLHIMNDAEQRSMIYTENGVAENLFRYNLWYMRPEHYLLMTDLMISIGDYALAHQWADRAAQYCENQLDTYKARLHTYYAEKNVTAFRACLEELRKSHLPADKEVLDLFRMYG